METAMQIQTFEPKRTPEGALDVRHYAREALAERREARTSAMRAAGRISKRIAIAAAGFIMFWNIPAMGGGGSKEMPYR